MGLTLRTLEPRPEPSRDAVVPLRLVRGADAPWAGRPGASLGELLAAGLEVPAGFVVARGVCADPASAASLRAALHRAYDGLCDEAGDRALPVLVRACGKTPPASLAGPARPPDSVARSVDALVEQVRRCGARGDPVLVQALVCGEAWALARGDPDDPARLRVEAALGCRPVAGQLLDRFTLDRASGAVLGVQAVHKAARLVPGADGGWEEQPVPADQAEAPSLTHEEAARLGEAARLAQSCLGGPHELEAAVEWRRSSRRIRILDVRPAASASPS